MKKILVLLCGGLTLWNLAACSQTLERTSPKIY